jgi:hypothetical protein
MNSVAFLFNPFHAPAYAIFRAWQQSLAWHLVVWEGLVDDVVMLPNRDSALCN